MRYGRKHVCRQCPFRAWPRCYPGTGAPRAGPKRASLEVPADPRTAATGRSHPVIERSADDGRSRPGRTSCTWGRRERPASRHIAGRSSFSGCGTARPAVQMTTWRDDPAPCPCQRALPSPRPLGHDWVNSASSAVRQPDADGCRRPVDFSGAPLERVRNGRPGVPTRAAYRPGAPGKASAPGHLPETRDHYEGGVGSIVSRRRSRLQWESYGRSRPRSCMADLRRNDSLRWVRERPNPDR